jgi:superfamily II DNA helicase RecQ
VAQAHYAIDGEFLHRLGPELVTAYEQASMAWHGLWDLSSRAAQGGGAGHRREASQQLTSRPIKRERVEVSDRALVGLQRIYHDIDAKPRSEGQASALQLVHHPSASRPLVIVLPTSSGKSALFFSVAAMTVQQTVIVVVPFAALVDDIIERGQAAGLHCEEWINEKSGHELQQLIVVSADRAVQGEFLHYAKGLELEGQLAHVFFDEVHVAFADTSYRERLRELWTLRYLDCPFTGLTATLIVELEDVLKERLCIDNAEIFRRSTARKTIRYRVRDSKNEAPSEVAVKYVQQLHLGTGKRGVIYVRSYETGGHVSTALKCPFYRARAEEKGEVLQQWTRGAGGWIVATGALGTGINIEGIVCVVHVGRPYGLTSFVQQHGRGGRNGELSDSVIITRVENSSGRRRSEIMSEYSVEQIDEDAMTEFIQSRGCRREVLGRYMDGVVEGASCRQIDGVFCDRCRTRSGPAASILVAEDRVEVEGPGVEEEVSGARVIGQRLKEEQVLQEQLIEVMDQLQGGCIYCGLMYQGYHEPHTYKDCVEAEQKKCGVGAFEIWREGVDLGQYQHCWKCGLSQKICRRLEDDGWCEYPDIMLPGLFVLHQQEHLRGVVEAVGFQGVYPDDVWEWLPEVGEGFGRQWESNWMRTWRMVCQWYQRMTKGEETVDENG